ncbi:MAG TPA: RidA family protein [Firmicutes bacterium]|nr:RidA family protein [Bacillota bacterium]
MIEEKLKDMGITLPEPSKPVGSYLPVVKSGRLVFLSGVISGKKGKVGKDLDIDEAYKEAEKCALILLSNLKREIGSLDKVKRVVKLEGFVNSEKGFSDQPKVINGASDLLVRLFGERGKHARIAVGVSELPLDSCVEISMIVEVENE